jgi:DNA repair exonuclease SbcCD ATPase subunit
MSVESVMFFALGFLSAGLLALMLVPSVWRRAVRLTKKRIEAATPMTLSEFKADKDQLRAEFAMSTRRLEMNVETLRRRLGDQLEEINRKKSDLVMLKADRDEQLQIIRELEDREANLRKRVSELEREGAKVANRLRQRERDFADKVNELNSLRAATKKPSRKIPAGANMPGAGLSGDYASDVEDLMSALDAERRRADFLEDQARALLERLEDADRQKLDAAEAISSLRSAVAEHDDRRGESDDKLTEAEARIARAESQLNAILEETGNGSEGAQSEHQQLLAEKLTLEEELARLRDKVGSVEQTILNEWNDDRVQHSHLRERLNDIAAEVSRLIYQVDGELPTQDDESLFDRVRRYAGESAGAADATGNGAARSTPAPGGDISSRMTALRDLRPN